MRIRYWPLRIRLVAITLFFAAIAIAFSDFIATTAVGNYLVNQIDTQNYNIGIGSVTRLDQFGLDPSAEDGGDQVPGNTPLGRVPTTTNISVIDARGTLIAQLGGEENKIRLNAADISSLNINKVISLDGRPFTILDSHDNQFRAIALPFASGYGSILVSTPLDSVEHTRHKLTALLILISFMILFLIALTAYFIIKWSFRPLMEIEQTASSIADGDLSARLDEDDSNTEVGNLKRSLNTMLTQIETSFKLKSESESRLRQFVADASHELRTPLTAIRGFSELIRQGAVKGEEKTKEVVERIENESLRMGSMVEDLLMLARLDQNPILNADPVDLNKLVAEAGESARVSGPNHPLTIELPSHEVYWLGDENRIHQCVANLLANARTHTPANTPITLSLIELENEIQIKIADQGPGLSEEDQNRIFERFYRADPSRTRQSGEGSGLGLAIVSAIMEASGGKISVESTVGNGATFTLHLPVLEN
jgi:two-component system OmpR family sensor kinase